MSKIQRVIQVQDLQRTYDVVTISDNKAKPVVIVLHGGGANEEYIEYQSGMTPIASKAGFVTVYPRGTESKWFPNKYYWNAGTTFKDPDMRKVDDVLFLSAVVKDLQKITNIDTKKIFVCGISNGAHMSYKVAAETDWVAGIGCVAGQRSVGMYARMPNRPINLIHFHGSVDTFNPYYGGVSDTGMSAFLPYQIPSVIDSIQSWVYFNQCKQGGAPWAVGNSICRFHYDGLEGSEVIFWTHLTGGHTWPGGKMSFFEKSAGVGNISKDIKASQEMIKFFTRHSL